MNLLNELNDKQIEAVINIDRPLLILAGAGSGKTRVITYKISYLIENGVDPYNILALTFTNKAANEMKERAIGLNSLANGVWISTFHSLCVMILRKEIDIIGYKNNFNIIDTKDSANLIKACLKELNLDEKTFVPKNIAAQISFNKNKMVDPKRFFIESQNDFRLSKIAEVYNLYQEKLRIDNLLDFDDLIFFVVKIFMNNDNVLEFYANRFKYILVDEYQDTNASQYLLIKLLTSKSKNICVVGDDDQSIYSWRGADIKNILEFEKDFSNAKIIKLEQNYRSTQIILDAANSVIKNNFNRKAKNLWTQEKNGDKICIYRAENYKLEADFLVNKILFYREQNKFDFKDCAVLYRNNFLSRIIEDEFVKRNIAYRLVGSTRFYDRMEIKDLIAYLKFINNPSDEISLLRIINTPRRGIGDKTLEKINYFALEEKISLWEALDIYVINSAKPNKNLCDFVGLIKNLLSYKENNSIYDLMQKIIFDINYKEYLEKQEECISRLENIEEFLAKIMEFEKSQDGEYSLTDFLEQIALLSEIDNYNQSENAVSLMTLHGAKGLEFPCVYIFGADDDIFPTNFKSDNELEEERRLFYVGITRAKKKLFISSAASRLRNGQIINSKESRFIKEIPRELIEYEANKKAMWDNCFYDKRKNSVENKFIKNVCKPDLKINLSGINKNLNAKPETKISAKNKNLKLNYSVGDKVRHFKFGVCIVKEILFIEDKLDYKIIIELADGQEKTFFASLIRFMPY